MILYIHVSVGTVYQCRGSACLLSLSNHHYHHDRRKNGIVNLRKFHNVIVPHFCISTPVLDKNCNIYQKGMVRTILSLSIME